MAKTYQIGLRVDKKTRETIDAACDYLKITKQELFLDAVFEKLKKVNICDKDIKQQILDGDRKNNLTDAREERKDYLNTIFQFNNIKEKIFYEFTRDMMLGCSFNELNYRKYVFMAKIVSKEFRYYTYKEKRLLRKDYNLLKKLMTEDGVKKYFADVQRNYQVFLDKNGRMPKSKFSPKILPYENVQTYKRGSG